MGLDYKHGLFIESSGINIQFYQLIVLKLTFSVAFDGGLHCKQVSFKLYFHWNDNIVKITKQQKKFVLCNKPKNMLPWTRHQLASIWIGGSSLKDAVTSPSTSSNPASQCTTWTLPHDCITYAAANCHDRWMDARTNSWIFRLFFDALSRP